MAPFPSPTTPSLSPAICLELLCECACARERVWELCGVYRRIFNPVIDLAVWAHSWWRRPGNAFINIQYRTIINSSAAQSTCGFILNSIIFAIWVHWVTSHGNGSVRWPVKRENWIHLVWEKRTRVPFSCPELMLIMGHRAINDLCACLWCGKY